MTRWNTQFSTKKRECCIKQRLKKKYFRKKDKKERRTRVWKQLFFSPPLKRNFSYFSLFFLSFFSLVSVSLSPSLSLSLLPPSVSLSVSSRRCFFFYSLSIHHTFVSSFISALFLFSRLFEEQRGQSWRGSLYSFFAFTMERIAAFWNARFAKTINPPRRRKKKKEKKKRKESSPRRGVKFRDESALMNLESDRNERIKVISFGENDKRILYPLFTQIFLLRCCWSKTSLTSKNKRRMRKRGSKKTFLEFIWLKTWWD